jgi:hypothetical protein
MPYLFPSCNSYDISNFNVITYYFIMGMPKLTLQPATTYRLAYRTLFQQCAKEVASDRRADVAAYRFALLAEYGFPYGFADFSANGTSCSPHDPPGP